MGGKCLKCLVYGWSGYDNLGDQQYMLTFPLLFPNCELDFSNKIPEDYKKYDKIILGGGNVLKPAFIKELKKHNIKAITLSTGMETPIETDCFSKAYVRDLHTFNHFVNNKVPTTLIPDAAFLLKPNKQNGEELIKHYLQNNDLYEKKIAIIINSYLTKAQLDCLSREHLSFLRFADEITNVIDNTNASFIFIPFGRKMPYDDRVSNAWIAHKCKFWKKNAVIYDHLSVQDTLDIISACDLTISTRLHSTIFSCASNIPFLDITHHDKNMEFLKFIHETDASINYYKFNQEELKDKINNYLNVKKDFSWIKSGLDDLNVRISE